MTWLLGIKQHSEAVRSEMMQYLVVIEKTETGYSAYSPDLSGCISTGATREETEQNMREAIEFHLAGMKLEGMEIPQPTTSSAYVEIAA